MSVLVAVTKEDLQAPGYKLVRSIRDDGGRFDSICPSKAFLINGCDLFSFHCEKLFIAAWLGPFG